MKQCWSSSELAQFWSLSDDEKQLSDQRTQQGRLGLAVLLKFFQLEGRFPSLPQRGAVARRRVPGRPTRGTGACLVRLSR